MTYRKTGLIVAAALLAASHGAFGWTSRAAAEPGPPLPPVATPAATKTVASPAPSIATPKPLPLPWHDTQVLIVRTALIALDDANKTNNYSVLRGISAPNLQAQTPEQLSAAFASLRALALDLAPAAIVTPEFSPPPFVDPQGLLQLSGVFRTQPAGIKFSVVMAPVDGYWRLAGLSVSGVKLPPAPARIAGATPPVAKRLVKKAAIKPKPPQVEARVARPSVATPVTTTASVTAAPVQAGPVQAPVQAAANPDGTPAATTAWRLN